MDAVAIILASVTGLPQLVGLVPCRQICRRLALQSIVWWCLRRRSLSFWRRGLFRTCAGRL